MFIMMTSVDRPKETIRRGALMKMLQQNALTLPLFISSKVEEKPPPLCGAIPAENNYVAKVIIIFIIPKLSRTFNSRANQLLVWRYGGCIGQRS